MNVGERYIKKEITHLVRGIVISAFLCRAQKCAFYFAFIELT